MPASSRFTSRRVMEATGECFHAGKKYRLMRLLSSTQERLCCSAHVKYAVQRSTSSPPSVAPAFVWPDRRLRTPPRRASLARWRALASERSLADPECSVAGVCQSWTSHSRTYRRRGRRGVGGLRRRYRTNKTGVPRALAPATVCAVNVTAMMVGAPFVSDVVCEKSG